METKDALTTIAISLMIMTGLMTLMLFASCQTHDVKVRGGVNTYSHIRGYGDDQAVKVEGCICR
jgi:hypothetical protein